MKEKKRPLTKKELLAAYAGSPLGMVNEILLSGKFAPAPSVPVGKGEMLIDGEPGKLTLFEKAVYTASEKVKKEHGALAESYRKILHPITSVKEEMDNTLSMIDQLKKTHEVLGSLLWLSIRKRLSALGINHSDLGIREGYQIIWTKTTEKNISEGLGELLAKIFLSAMPGMGEENDDHKCDTCPGYDLCDLPQKKPRASGMESASGHA